MVNGVHIKSKTKTKGICWVIATNEMNTIVY